MQRTALVTGASSGIGAAVANLLCERGFDVFGTTRSNNPVSQKFQKISLNVDSDISVLECVGKVLSKNKRVDVLVNNAGYALMGAAEETSIAEARAQFETNFFGVARMVNAVLPTMRKAGTGRIINIGSLAGLTAIPFSPFYCATKFPIEGYSESLWHELKRLGISVTIIEPGFVHTELTRASRTASKLLSEYERQKKRVADSMSHVVERGILPERVSEAVLRAVESRKPQLRYRVGADAQWLPRQRSVAPWNLYAFGVRKKFAVDVLG
jgi:short-subunit dehydrogenase